MPNNIYFGSVGIAVLVFVWLICEIHRRLDHCEEQIDLLARHVTTNDMRIGHCEDKLPMEVR